MSSIFLRIPITEQISKDISTVEAITKQSIGQFLFDELSRYFNQFRNENGEIKAIAGFVKPSEIEINAYEQAKARGANPYALHKPTPKPCFILKRTTVLGMDYTTVWMDGNICKVPTERVEVRDGDKK